jgi:uncharacterized Zn finger protein
MAWWRYFAYTPRPPKEVKGGIKAQSRRGSFGSSWWALRWQMVLESFDIGARLSRGRAYARRGQVMDITIDTGEVRARVQGSRSRPYEVQIRFRPLSREEWHQVVQALSARFLPMAKLLAGEMPEDMEEVFHSAKQSLFPYKLNDLTTDCTCPDWSNPCKHVAAVFYLLGEEFDRDPFLLFKLRGLSREELFEMLGYSAPAPSGAPGQEGQGVPEPAGEELPADPAAFWGGAQVPQDPFGEVRPSAVLAALPKQLGTFPFWRGQAPFLEAVEPFYVKAAAFGLDIFLGLPQPQVEEPPAPAAAKPINPSRQAARTPKGTSRPKRRGSRKLSSKKKTPPR